MKTKGFLAAVALSLAVAAQAAEKPRVIRWLVAHDRGHNAFTDLNKKWAHELEKKSRGALKIEFVTSRAEESQLDESAYREVAQGRSDMSQLPATAVEAHVLDMPFLFRSYKHAEAVFASPVADKMLAGVSESSGDKVRGLAFTYSGGYRILAGGKAVRVLADLKGARVRKSRSHLAPFLESVGAKLVKVEASSKQSPLDDVAAGKLDLDETEINRLALVEKAHPGLVKKLGNVNLTRHRMYVTAIVANEKFLQSLPAAQRDLLASEVEKLATAERKLSIDLEAKNLKFLAKSGATVVEFAESDKPAFAKAGEEFRKSQRQLAGLIADIQAVRDTDVAGR
jgi:TRAP-type transport system periplasmic protein